MSANDYLKGGKHWKASSIAIKDTASNSTATFTDVTNVSTAVVSSARVQIPPATPATVAEIRLTRNGVVEFTEQLTGSTSATNILDLIGSFGSYNTAGIPKIQGTSMYCKTSFQLEVRYISGTVQNVTGICDYTLGSMERV